MKSELVGNIYRLIRNTVTSGAGSKKEEKSIEVVGRSRDSYMKAPANDLNCKNELRTKHQDKEKSR